MHAQIFLETVKIIFLVVNIIFYLLQWKRLKFYGKYYFLNFHWLHRLFCMLQKEFSGNLLTDKNVEQMYYVLETSRAIHSHHAGLSQDTHHRVLGRPEAYPDELHACIVPHLCI